LIIDAFLVRASENTVRYNDGAYVILTEKARDLVADNGIVADVGSIGEPTFDKIRLIAFIRDNGNSDLRSQIRGRAVEGDRGDRVASESASDSLRQPGAGTLDLLHLFMKYLRLG
jgi:hypothetical protein